MVGAGTLTARHLLLMAGISLLVELQTSIRRHVPVYSSMVRLNACWASLVSLSTSVSTTTDHKINQVIIKFLRKNGNIIMMTDKLVLTVLTIAHTMYMY